MTINAKERVKGLCRYFGWEEDSEQVITCIELVKLAEEEARAEAIEECARVAKSYLMIGATMMNPQFEQIAKNLELQIRSLKTK